MDTVGSPLLVLCLVCGMASAICSAYTILRPLLPLLASSPLALSSSKASPPKSLKSAQRLSLFLAALDLLGVACLIWEVVDAASAFRAVGSTNYGAGRIWVCFTGRTTSLLVIALLSCINVLYGKSIPLGVTCWIVWLPTLSLVLLGLFVILTSSSGYTSAQPVWSGILGWLVVVAVVISVSFWSLWRATSKVGRALGEDFEEWGQSYIPPIHLTHSEITVGFIEGSSSASSSHSSSLPSEHTFESLSRPASSASCYSDGDGSVGGGVVGGNGLRLAVGQEFRDGARYKTRALSEKDIGGAMIRIGGHGLGHLFVFILTLPFLDAQAQGKQATLATQISLVLAITLPAALLVFQNVLADRSSSPQPHDSILPISASRSTLELRLKPERVLHAGLDPATRSGIGRMQMSEMMRPMPRVLMLPAIVSGRRDSSVASGGHGHLRLRSLPDGIARLERKGTRAGRAASMGGLEEARGSMAPPYSRRDELITRSLLASSRNHQSRPFSSSSWVALERTRTPSPVPSWSTIEHVSAESCSPAELLQPPPGRFEGGQRSLPPGYSSNSLARVSATSAASTSIESRRSVHQATARLYFTPNSALPSPVRPVSRMEKALPATPASTLAESAREVQHEESGVLDSGESLHRSLGEESSIAEEEEGSGEESTEHVADWHDALEAGRDEDCYSSDESIVSDLEDFDPQAFEDTSSFESMLVQLRGVIENAERRRSAVSTVPSEPGEGEDLDGAVVRVAGLLRREGSTSTGSLLQRSGSIGSAVTSRGFRNLLVEHSWYLEEDVVPSSSPSGVLSPRDTNRESSEIETVVDPLVKAVGKPGVPQRERTRRTRAEGRRRLFFETDPTVVDERREERGTSSGSPTPKGKRARAGASRDVFGGVADCTPLPGRGIEMRSFR